jgi:hypothetical protein
MSGSQIVCFLTKKLPKLQVSLSWLVPSRLGAVHAYIAVKLYTYVCVLCMYVYIYIYIYICIWLDALHLYMQVIASLCMWCLWVVGACIMFQHSNIRVCLCLCLCVYEPCVPALEEHQRKQHKRAGQNRLLYATQKVIPGHITYIHIKACMGNTHGNSPTATCVAQVVQRAGEACQLSQPETKLLHVCQATHIVSTRGLNTSILRRWILRRDNSRMYSVLGSIMQ